MSSQVLDVWKPPGGMPAVLIRWLVTYWCNYRCPYCPQNHDRHAIYGEYTAHAFDNHPVQDWLHAFSRHFRDKRLALTVTGGEPLLDRKSMPVLLKELSTMESVACIRVDTNGSFDPKHYAEVDLTKITLMCTFHPTQVTEEKFFNRIDQLRTKGFRIGMVNYVMAKDAIGLFERRRQELAKRGIPLHPNPLWNSEGVYSHEDRELMRRHLPDLDFRFRTQTESPRGKKCLFPMIAYQMNPGGSLHVGCHPKRAGSIFDQQLPELFQHPASCPAGACMCLDMYSFLDGENRNRTLDPLWDYRNTLLELDTVPPPRREEQNPIAA